MPTSGFKMIATATCPTCRHEFWLLDEPMFDPGWHPPEYPGESPITFMCCGQVQSVPPSNIVYRPQRVIGSKSSGRRLPELVCSRLAFWCYRQRDGGKGAVHYARHKHTYPQKAQFNYQASHRRHTPSGPRLRERLDFTGHARRHSGMGAGKDSCRTVN
jgi:hypothetical protein